MNGALRFPPPGDTAGVVLFLHGCDGLGPSGTTDSLFAWQREWVRHLNQRGFLVVAPNSFADARPPVSCVAPFPEKNAIYALRKRQVAFELGELRQELPAIPFLLWGHSEGAGVANMARWEVEGMITTGYQCGFQGTRRILADTATPLLVIAGTRDSYIADALRAARLADITEYCAPALRSPRWRLLVQRDMGHSAPLSRPQLRSALDALLGDVAPAAWDAADKKRR